MRRISHRLVFASLPTPMPALSKLLTLPSLLQRLEQLRMIQGKRMPASMRSDATISLLAASARTTHCAKHHSYLHDIHRHCLQCSFACARLAAATQHLAASGRRLFLAQPQRAHCAECRQLVSGAALDASKRATAQTPAERRHARGWNGCARTTADTGRLARRRRRSANRWRFRQRQWRLRQSLTTAG